MEAIAHLRHLQASPQKVRLVVDLIRGKNVEEAAVVLRTTKKSAARPIEKLLKSAIANAENRDQNVDVGKLYVKEVFVDGGPTLKRIQANTMGRAFRILKRQSHVTIKLDTRKAGAAGAPRSAAKLAPAKQRDLPSLRGRRRPPSAPPREGSSRGSENSSVRIPPGLQQDLALPLVRRRRVLEAPALGSQAPRRSQEATGPCRRLRDRHRARRRQDARHDLHLASGHHHRPQGRRGRQAARRPRQDDRPRDPHQHPGDPASRARCPAGLGVDRRAARAPRLFPPRDEEGDGDPPSGSAPRA